MNRFEQHASAPPTEEQWIRREEAIQRTGERRLLAQDLAWEYRYEVEYEEPDDPEYLNELREFTGYRAALIAETGCTPEEVAAVHCKSRIPRMQMEMFEEVEYAA